MRNPQTIPPPSVEKAFKFQKINSRKNPCKKKKVYKKTYAQPRPRSRYATRSSSKLSQGAKKPSAPSKPLGTGNFQGKKNKDKLFSDDSSSSESSSESSPSSDSSVTEYSV